MADETVSIELTDEMKIELGDTLSSLITGQAKLQRLFALADAKIAQQDVTIAEQNVRIAVLTKLVESHQAELEILRMRQQGGGIVQ
ncbi:hypothetical protein [Tunturiibacter gelidoferens]|uniref:Coiled-coil protein SlyX n=1 Tax=Tunturiibacter gelidiferens TaxID=3069689 RepID=A0A9X0QGS7_9BACT|nr:hypothetical protein [Edaphobacter lichenicola]MBB5329989.1 putative coiled-coil protein SlyX [Edaphobacter lichenicola]